MVKRKADKRKKGKVDNHGKAVKPTGGWENVKRGWRNVKTDRAVN